MTTKLIIKNDCFTKDYWIVRAFSLCNPSLSNSDNKHIAEDLKQRSPYEHIAELYLKKVEADIRNIINKDLEILSDNGELIISYEDSEIKQSDENTINSFINTCIFKNEEYGFDDEKIMDLMMKRVKELKKGE